MSFVFGAKMKGKHERKAGKPDVVPCRELMNTDYSYANYMYLKVQSFLTELGDR